MTFLILAILINALIFVCFKYFGVLKVDTLQAIVVNYFVCVITGFVFLGDWEILSLSIFSRPWFLAALMLGIVFISTFFLMAYTTQNAGITVATIAAKMSLIIPVLFSLFIFKNATKHYDFWNVLGIVLALVSIVLTSLKKEEQKRHLFQSLKLLGLPVLVFVLSGVIDTTLNFVSDTYLTSAQDQASFPIVNFGVAGIAGLILTFISKSRWQRKSVVAGIALGVPNYFSIYLIIKVLDFFHNDGAFTFPILNMGIILTSTLFALLLFKERLSVINKLGVALAVLALILVAYQEIGATF